MKKKVFSWVVVFDFMVLILHQKVLWHHKMCSDSKISSQNISEDTPSCSKSMLSIHEKNWKNIMKPSKWPIFDNIDVAWEIKKIFSGGEGRVAKSKIFVKFCWHEAKFSPSHFRIIGWILPWKVLKKSFFQCVKNDPKMNKDHL